MFREAGAFYQKRQWNVASGLFLQPCTVRGLNIGQFKGFSLGPLGLYLSSKFVHSIIFWIEGGNKNKMSGKITA